MFELIESGYHDSKRQLCLTYDSDLTRALKIIFQVLITSEASNTHFTTHFQITNSSDVAWMITYNIRTKHELSEKERNHICNEIHNRIKEIFQHTEQCHLYC